MTYNTCRSEDTPSLTMTVQLACCALFAVGRSNVATHRETLSQFTLSRNAFTSGLDLGQTLHQGQYLMRCLPSEWGALSFTNMPMMQANTALEQRQAAVPLSEKEVDSEKSTSGSNRREQGYRKCRRDGKGILISK